MKLIFPLKVQMAEPTGDRKLSIHFHCTEENNRKLEHQVLLENMVFKFSHQVKMKIQKYLLLRVYYCLHTFGQHFHFSICDF